MASRLSSIRSLPGCSVSIFVFADTFVCLKALIFLVKTNDYANALNQPSGAFSRAV